MRSKVVACDACQPASVRRACQNSWSMPCAGSTTIRWRSPVPGAGCLERGPGRRQRLGVLVPRQRPVLDRRIVGNRKRARVRLRGVLGDPHGHPRLVGRHDDEVHVEVEPERLVGADRRRTIGADCRMDRPLRDVLVPGIVGREDLQRAQDAVGFRRVEQHGLPEVGGLPRPARLRDGAREFQPAASYGSPVSGKLTRRRRRRTRAARSPAAHRRQAGEAELAGERQVLMVLQPAAEVGELDGRDRAGGCRDPDRGAARPLPDRAAHRRRGCSPGHRRACSAVRGCRT